MTGDPIPIAPTAHLVVTKGVCCVMAFGTGVARLLGSDAFAYSESGPPRIDSKASLMAASKTEVAWLMLEGGQVRRT